jgi:FixJ family two-component response regulator
MLDAITSGIALDRSRLMADFDIFRMWQRYDSLSRREQQVMMLVTAGKMNKHVAGDLGISEITVKIYRRHAKDGCSHLRRSCQNGRNDQAQG